MSPNADKGAINALGSSVPKLWLVHFAAFVAAQERERIAKLSADLAGTSDFDKSTCDYLAATIRALNTEGDGNDKQPASD